MRRGGLFPVTPEGNFAEAEGVPPEVEHGLIEIENSAASDACRRRNEGGEARIDLGALGAGGARKKMPERQGILFARFRKNCSEGGVSGRRIFWTGIELRDGLAESGRGVFEIRNAGAECGARGAHGAGGDEGVAPVEMKADPAERSAKGAGAIGSDLKRVGAAEIDGDGGRCVHDEGARRRPDRGVNGADVELNAFAICIGLHEAEA